MLRKILIALLIIGAYKSPLIAISPDQTNTERFIKETRYFLDFVDIPVANFGTEKNVEMLKQANQHSFNANLWYLQSDYTRSFKEIRRSQEIMRDLYLDLLQNRYLEDSRQLLDISAPEIIQAKDKHAENFLRLGYRDLAGSRQYMLKGYNYNRFLFSNKIRLYIDGIKRARRAKRFAFLALLESKTPYEEKAAYRLQTLDEHLNGVEKDGLSDYERVRNKLRNFISRKLIEDKYNYSLHHHDNYGLIIADKKSILNEAVKELHTNDVSGKEIPPSSEETDKGNENDQKNN